MKSSTVIGVALAFAALLSQPQTSGAATITLNFDSTYQTIDGFGGFGGKQPWWTGGPFHDDNFLRLTIDEIGMTLFRTECYPGGAGAGDNSKQIGFFNAVKAYAASKNEPVRFFATVWSPPANMKTTGSTVGGGLIPGKEQEYATYLVDYLKWFKQQVGVDLIAIGPANEPQAGDHFFNCAAYTELHMGQTCVAVGRAIKTAGLPTVVAASDDLVNFGPYNRKVFEEVDKHPDVKDVVTIQSHHYGGDDFRLFAPYGGSAFKVGRKAWNTEFGNGPDSWDHSWINSKAIYHMLNWNYNAVVYWLIGPHTNAGQAEESLMYNMQMGPKAYGAKAFFRYIRPGAIRVKSTSNDATVFSLAFIHPTNKTLTLVLLNGGSGTANVTLPTTGNLPSQWEVYLTGNGNNCVQKGTAAPGASISIPSKTIATLYNGQHPLEYVSVKPAARIQAAIPAFSMPKTSVHYGIDGRVRSGNAATGVLISTSVNSRKAIVETRISVR